MLSEQIKQQIEQEGEHYANVQIGDKAKFIGHHDSRRWDDAKEDWEAGAEKYAALWQAAEEKAARYEKALNRCQTQVIIG